MNAPTGNPRRFFHEPTAAELSARRARNIALGVVLAGLVVLFYVVTLAKLGLRLPGVTG